jgi:hypothetical protein
MDDHPAFQFLDHKDKPGSNQPIVHYRKITRPDVLNMILQERGPSLPRRLRFFAFWPVFLAGPFTDFDAQLKQLALDPF